MLHFYHFSLRKRAGWMEWKALPSDSMNSIHEVPKNDNTFFTILDLFSSFSYIQNAAYKGTDINPFSSIPKFLAEIRIISSG